jgi:hypothetical protein
MAIKPGDLLKKDAVDKALADTIEGFIDELLITANVREGKACLFNIAKCLSGKKLNTATEYEIASRFQKAGWRKVRFLDDGTSEGTRVISLTCPRYRNS